MTGEQLKRALRNAGLSQRGTAKELEINERTMRRYISGEQPIPRVVEYAVRWLLSLTEKQPITPYVLECPKCHFRRKRTMPECCPNGCAELYLAKEKDSSTGDTER